MKIENLDGLSASINDAQYPLVIITDGIGDINRVLKPTTLDVDRTAIIGDGDLAYPLTKEDIISYLIDELNYEELPLVHSS